MLIGLAAIYSATLERAQEGAKMIFYRQLTWFIIGIAVLFIASNLNYRRLFEVSYILYGISIIFLIVVLFLGRHILGAQRWLEVGGFNFQPSELTKFSVILILSRYLSHKRFYSGGFNKLWQGLIVPLILAGIPMFLIFLQPDLGTAALIFIIFISLVFYSELELKHLAIFIGLILGSMPFFWHLLKDYQKDRLMVFLNPNIDPLGAGYTIIQSKIAIGSGMFWEKVG
jgi:Bacterial cell division membrane protein